MDTFGWVVVWIICAFVAGSMNSSKGRSYGDGFALGLFLGVIGVLIVAVLPKNEMVLEKRKLNNGTGKKCPYCAEIIKQEATVCRYCGRDLSEPAFAAGGIHISKEEYTKLTYRQKSALLSYNYLLSPEDALKVSEMIASSRAEDMLLFCQANGKKVAGIEK